MVQSSLPPQMKILAGQFEDNMSEWVKRDVARPRWDTLRHGERARHLLGDLIDGLTVVYGELGREVEAYRVAVRKVGA
ncbi:MAG TPA: hypothetical protein VFR23_23255 [Jiangellaceae bacterium]|nr:hypothetical protein [Jiangellaceae bacterium]